MRSPVAIDVFDLPDPPESQAPENQKIFSLMAPVRRKWVSVPGEPGLAGACTGDGCRSPHLPSRSPLSPLSSTLFPASGRGARDHGARRSRTRGVRSSRPAVGGARARREEARAAEQAHDGRRHGRQSSPVPALRSRRHPWWSSTCPHAAVAAMAELHHARARQRRWPGWSSLVAAKMESTGQESA
jgi:hypothetical protein